jgi:hypothetical protein
MEVVLILVACYSHAVEPLQVLPMDAPDRQNHLHMGCCCPRYGRIHRLQDRRKHDLRLYLAKDQNTDMMRQGLWDFRAKRKGDLLVER